MCKPGADETPFGMRIFVGRWSDAYLGRYPVRPGYAYVIWKGRHVAEPTELSDGEAAGFWGEVAHVARAVAARTRPVKMNWLSLGNGVPHLHVHLVPRPADDARAGGPLEAEAFDRDRTPEVPDDVLRAEAEALRAALTTRWGGPAQPSSTSE
jgi:diadenosine tetraphosphate (Ap4A) HIT family hydrolase